MVAHTFSPGTWEPEAGESLSSGQPGLHSEPVSQKQQKTNYKKKGGRGTATCPGIGPKCIPSETG